MILPFFLQLNFRRRQACFTQCTDNAAMEFLPERVFYFSLKTLGSFSCLLTCVMVGFGVMGEGNLSHSCFVGLIVSLV